MTDRTFLHSIGVTMDDSPEPIEPMVSATRYVAVRDSCDLATLRAIRAEKRADRLQHIVNWMIGSVSINLLVWMAYGVWMWVGR